jgi:hypothetical protein
MPINLPLHSMPVWWRGCRNFHNFSFEIKPLTAPSGPDKIVLRRDESNAWNGNTIRIDPDGLISREHGADCTWVDPDGSVLKETDFVEATMPSDGGKITQRTPTNLAVINDKGMISRAR